MRTEIDDASYNANSVITEPLSTIAGLDLWAYFNSTNPPTNLVSDTPLISVGTPARNYAYTTITGAVDYYTAPNCLDATTQTLVFVAKLDKTGGNFAPIFTAYPGAAGLFVGLGYNYIRVHASGFGAIASFQFPSIVGNMWGFYSVTLESGSATPIKAKNWTFNLESTGGTAFASRTTLGGTLSLAQHNIATTGIFPAQIAFGGRATSVLTDAQILSIKSTVEANIAQLGISIL